MDNSTFYRPTKAVVNLNAIRSNIRSLKAHLGSTTLVIAVVKADGYGHGAIEVSRAALEAGAGMISVATPDEAVRLRMGGISGDILLMGPSPVSFAEKAAELGIIVTVFQVDWLQAALDQNKSFAKRLKIHVKIDSGMGRIGLRDAKTFQSLMSLAGRSGRVTVDGVFSHFSCADTKDSKKTKEQFQAFMTLINLLPEKPRLTHVSNSAGALLFPEYALDAVRFGISLYGIPSSDYVGQNLPFPLEKSMTLESELVHVKLLEKGSPVSYGATYVTKEDEWVGTIPIGYADGLRRSLQGQDVLVGGRRTPIIGKICMDQCMVRLPREFPIGEKVVLIGRQGDKEITFEEWAKRLGTIPYEIAVSIAGRIPRIYKGV